jgi:hypothetical protein
MQLPHQKCSGLSSTPPRLAIERDCDLAQTVLFLRVVQNVQRESYRARAKSP